MRERWAPVEGYEGYYEVSSIGRVYSLPRRCKSSRGGRPSTVPGKVLLPDLTGVYAMVTLCKNGKTKAIAIHRLVASAFVPNPENKPEVNHKDADKRNNQADNLEWVTKSEQALHAILLGRWPDNKGSSNGQSKLDEVKVSMIKKRLLLGHRISQIARDVGVHEGTIYSIRDGRTWRHVT